MISAILSGWGVVQYLYSDTGRVKYLGMTVTN
jgi:hypothetical protein